MLRHQESKLGVGVAWLLGPLGGLLAGFYLGTIWASPTDLDLVYSDIQRGFLTGGIGLALGIVFAILVTIFYPPTINREYREMEEHEHNHHH